MKRVLALLCVIACLAMLCIPALAAQDTITIYAKVPDSWESVAAYTWEPDDLGPWPGTQMTLNDDGWYEVSMPGTHTTVIINNNNNGAQTSDLVIEAGKDVWITVADDNSATVAYDPAGTPSAPPAASTELTDAYVAGEGTLCGSAWDPGDAANKMTEVSDGVFEITYKNVAAGTYQLKVTNGTWDVSFGGDGPDGNYVLNVALDGDVTITFDSATSTITASGAGSAGSAEDIQQTEPQPVEVTEAYVAGVGTLCGAEWDAAAPANKMTEVSDGVFEITYKNVAAGSYELKITNGTWDASWGADGGADNYVLNVETAGDVTITFDSATTTITATVSEPAATEPSTEATEPSTEATEPSTEETEPSESTEATEPTVDKSAARTRTLLVLALVFVCIVGVAVVMSIVPSKNI